MDSILYSPQNAYASAFHNVFVAKNGTPAENVAKVIEMRFGGIENFIGTNDVVVINPNGQWPEQGGSNCACCMGLIDLILNRPGGFNGEIILTECTQFQMEGYWTATGSDLIRNGPYGFNDMITHYHSLGYNYINGVRLWRNSDDASNWPAISGPSQGQGWVRFQLEFQANESFGLSYPIILSPYSGKLIDLKNGVYDEGYSGQPALKFIKMPNLNNHSSYAGITSTIKSFMGICEIGGPPGMNRLHAYDKLGAYAVGQAIGGWINSVRKPDLFLTTAEWVGWGGRTGSMATQAKTVGIADDPVTLDYYMCKYVMWPTQVSQQYFNPDYDVTNNASRKTMNGCQSQGFGTTNEAEMLALVYDFNNPEIFRIDIDRKIKEFRDGQASEQDVLDLIEIYNNGAK